MTIEVSGIIWYWKGPAPHFFVTVQEEYAREIKAMEKLVTYGWGMIPVVARICNTEWTTALWPKDGLYIVGIKANVRKAEGLEEGDEAKVRLLIGE